MAANEFPNFTNGDVKIVLSERPEDVLMLDTAVLAKDSAFFRASLQRLEWSQNKLVTTKDGQNQEHSYTLLELDFDGDDALPLLLGNTIETSSEELQRKRKDHDHNLGRMNEKCFTGNVYKSNTVASAYKVAFALMHDLRIEFPTSTVQQAAHLIPVVVDILDAYGLLPSYIPKVFATIFGTSCDGYELVAAEPFRFLNVACKLQSKIIYQEAMIHAIGIHDKFGKGQQDPDLEWFLEIGEAELHASFQKHAREFREKIVNIERHFLYLQPDCCNKIGAARDVGVAIFRDWISSNVSPFRPGHTAIVKILKHQYNVSDIISRWEPRRTNQIVNMKFGHIHRAVENCFEEANIFITQTFNLSKKPTAAPRQRVGNISHGDDHGSEFSYYANLYFAEGYQYPWEKEKAEIPKYVLTESDLPKVDYDFILH